MTGAVFHPGHDEWHGQTVVVFTRGPRTVVGRWDAVHGESVHMLDAAVHEQGRDDEDRDAWVARLKTYGIPVAHKTLTLPRSAIERIVRLRDA